MNFVVARFQPKYTGDLVINLPPVGSVGIYMLGHQIESGMYFGLYAWWHFSLNNTPVWIPACDLVYINDVTPQVAREYCSCRTDQELAAFRIKLEHTIEHGNSSAPTSDTID